MKKEKTFYKREFKQMIVESIDNGQKISTISKESVKNKGMEKEYKKMHKEQLKLF